MITQKITYLQYIATAITVGIKLHIRSTKSQYYTFSQQKKVLEKSNRKYN